MDKNCKNGACIVILSSWQEFKQKSCSLKSKRGYVWRGQKKDENSGCPLQSSFDRDIKIKDQRDRTKRLKQHIENFKEAMNKFFPNILPKEDIDVWALGQHYGLKTPLLDWTLSPYIAAYFAFIEEIDQNDSNDCYRYVYALNRSLERLISKRKKSNQMLSSDRSVPFIDQLPYPNPRFKAQQGILTKAFQGNDILKYVQSFSKKRTSELLIVKFRIPSKDRKECLHDLHSKNINHMSLLLDFRKVVNDCNSKLERLDKD